MSKVEIKVQFETITPLWTGDAWMENNEIRPSSLIGSLRFWFEVICYFGGVCSAKDFDKEKGRFEKDISNKEIHELLLKHGTDFNGQIAALKELEVPIPAIIFGTTGWKSLIEINGIRYLDDYCFGNKLNLSTKFCISKNENKEVKESNECPKRSNDNWSVFYFKIPYFWGRFEVVFRVHKDIKEVIFFPLLSFMDKYGYWGGGWNIGYGRLKILSVYSQNGDWKEEGKFDFSKFVNSESVINNYIEKIQNLNSLKDKELKIEYWTKKFNSQPIKDILKELIKDKATLRKNASNQKERHYIFGKTGNIQGEDLPQGSKILPYINRLDNNSYESGFLSIAGILRLYEEKKDVQ